MKKVHTWTKIVCDDCGSDSEVFHHSGSDRNICADCLENYGTDGEKLPDEDEDGFAKRPSFEEKQLHCWDVYKKDE